MSSGYHTGQLTSTRAGMILKDTARTYSLRTVCKKETVYSFKVEHQSQNVRGRARKLSGKREFGKEHVIKRPCFVPV